MNFPPPPQVTPYNHSNNNQQQTAAGSLMHTLMSVTQQATQQRQEQQFLENLSAMVTGSQQRQPRGPFGQSGPMQAPHSRICYHCRETVKPGENHTARNCPLKKKEDEEAAAARAEKIVQEKMARGEIVVKQELEVPAGCMRSLIGAYSAGNAIGMQPNLQPNFGSCMTPGYSTPGSMMVPMQQPPPTYQQQHPPTYQQQHPPTYQQQPPTTLQQPPTQQQPTQQQR